MAARTRVSSVTTPSFKGTLKSTRIRTRLPSTSMSRTVLLGESHVHLPFNLIHPRSGSAL